MKQYFKTFHVKLRIAVSFCLCMISFASFAQKDSLVRFVNPSSVGTPKGYSHASVIDLGNVEMAILSGQVPLDKDGNLVGKADVARQTEQVFTNIRNILTALGGAMDNVVKIGIYMIDVSQIQAVRNVRDQFINREKPPASTLVQVDKLFRDDVLIEIEATAIIPKK